MPVELSVNSQLGRIQEELKQIAQMQERVVRGFNDVAKHAGDGIEENSKRSQRAVNTLGDLARRTANAIKEDFKALLSLNAVVQSLKFSKVIGDSVRETVALADTLRKLSTVFNIPEDRFKRFHANLIQGFGQIGLSSEQADQAIRGLGKTPVRGEKNLEAYALAAGQLAGISGQRGQEAQISQALAQAVIARGQNPQDPNAMRAVADDVLRIRKATGMGAAESLGAMNDLFSGAHADFQSRLRRGGGVSLAAAALSGGEQATGFLEEYLRMNNWRRAGLEAQGFKNIIGQNGALDSGVVGNIVREAARRGGGDTQAGLTTMGLSPDQAQGFIRLAQALQQNEEAINGAARATVDMNKEFRDTMGLFESATAVMSRFKAMFRSLIVEVEADITSLLKTLAGSDAGAAVGVGGATLLAARGAGMGLSILKGAASGGVAGATGAAGAAGLSMLPAAAAAGVAWFGVRNERAAAESALVPVRAAEKRHEYNKGIAAEIESALDQKFNQMRLNTQGDRVIIELKDERLGRFPDRGRGESYGPTP